MASTEHGARAPPWPVLKAALVGFLTFLQGRGLMEVFASQVAGNSAVLLVDAALTPEGCQLGWHPEARNLSGSTTPKKSQLRNHLNLTPPQLQ